MLGDILPAYGIAMLISSSIFLAAWLISLRVRNGAIADIAWAGGFTVLIIFYCLFNEGWYLRKIILAAMVALWSIRMTVYLGLRTIKHLKVEDTRYKQLREASSLPAWIYFLWIFFCQALLQTLVTIPFLVSSMDSHAGLRANELIAILLFAPALLGEVIADKQLSDFKEDQRSKGRVLKTGLWRYSRHPNYFFEWLIWCSFFIFASASPYGIWSVLSPLVMLHMLLNVSGVKISEQVSLTSRGADYRQYQQETSAFFPWFPKRS